MPRDPGISFFVSFYDLDPSKENRCIYFTKRGTRCKWDCCEKDNQRATVLRDSFLKVPVQAISIEALEEYAHCNCCLKGNALHQDRIEDVGLLRPLAQRWFEEIRLQALRHVFNEADILSVQQNKSYNCNHSIPSAFPPNVKDERCAITYNSSRDRLVSPTSPGAFENPSISETLPTFAESTPTPLNATGVLVQQHENNSRYDLRNRRTNDLGNTPQTRPSYSPPGSRSEFRPHIAEPSPRDCVYQKMLDPLKNREFEDGRLYIFDRNSSPGYVKIGWTAKSVSDRLASWSKCGYTPNLLFSTSAFPSAERAETLTHYELIKQWRRERMCKAPSCRISHKEWFEISREQAKQVVSHWAHFMALARPYNKYGQLKPQWKEAIEMIHKESGLVTAQKLLGSYQASLINAGPALDKPVHSLYTPKIKEGITILRPKPIQLKASKKEDMSSNLSSMKLPELSDHTALVKKEISKKEPTGQRVVTSKPPSGPNLIRKLAPILNTILIKEELKPEEIPLPLSPISEPGSPRTTAPYSQCTAEGSGIGVVRPSKADSVTTPDTTQSVLLSTQYSIVSTSSSSALKSETTTDAFYCPTNNSSSEVRHISVQIDSSDPPAKGSLIKPKTKFRLKKKSINYINQL